MDASSRAQTNECTDSASQRVRSSFAGENHGDDMRIAGHSVIVFSLVLCAPRAISADPDLREALAAIEHSDKPIFSLHGLPDPALRPLVEHRFAATRAILQVLSSGDVSIECERKLWLALGYTKDPDSILWIQNNVDHFTKHGCDSWIFGWLPRFPGHGDLYSKFVVGRERWAQFFRAQFDETKDEACRWRYLQVLRVYFHDDETIAWASAKTIDDASPLVFLILQQYLLEHGVYPSRHAVQVALQRLERSSDEALAQHAAMSMPHEGCIAFLIQMLGRDDGSEDEAVNKCLRRISVTSDCSTRAEWLRWYQSHRDESRKQWLEAAIRRIEELVSTSRPSPDAAAATRAVADAFGADPALAEVMEHRWASEPALREAVLMWICSMEAYPYWRARLSSLAESLCKDGPQMSVEARGALERRAARADEILRATWIDYVDRAFGGRK